MPKPKSFLGAGAVNGKLYAIGGWPKMTEVYEYDPAEDEWTQKADMLTDRCGFGVGVVDGKIYVMGGLGHRFTQ